jgi:hypothetical protein
MVECVDVPIVHVEEGVGGKFNCLLHSGTPFLDGRIELNQQICLELVYY